MPPIDGNRQVRDETLLDPVRVFAWWHKNLRSIAIACIIYCLTLWILLVINSRFWKWRLLRQTNRLRAARQCRRQAQHASAWFHERQACRPTTETPYLPPRSDRSFLNPHLKIADRWHAASVERVYDKLQGKTVASPDDDGRQRPAPCSESEGISSPVTSPPLLDACRIALDGNDSRMSYMSVALLSPIASVGELEDISDRHPHDHSTMRQAERDDMGSPSTESSSTIRDLVGRIADASSTRSSSTMRPTSARTASSKPTRTETPKTPIVAPLVLDPFYASLDSDVHSSGITGRRPSPAVPWINNSGVSRRSGPLVRSPSYLYLTSSSAASRPPYEVLEVPKHRSRHDGCSRGRTMTDRSYPSMVGSPPRPITESEKGFIRAVHRTLRWRNGQEMQSFYRYWDEWIH